jgi:hypothetical protein
MNKVVMLINITSNNVLPVMERWLLQVHAPETIARIGPWLTRYQSYRATSPPPEMYAEVENFGYYNWRVTELWHRPGEAYGQQGILPQEFFGGYKQYIGLPTDVADAETWHGKRAGPRQVVRCLVPARATEDFKGGDKPPSAYRSILRWLTIFKLPAGVSDDEGDRWFLDVHAKEVLQQTGLTRFTSHKVIPAARGWNWHRVNELWFEDFDAWRNATVVNQPRYTPPPWVARGIGHARYPFFEPFVDFASTFLLEAPTNTFWPAYGDYLVCV